MMDHDQPGEHAGGRPPAHSGPGARTIARLAGASLELAAFLVFVFQTQRVVRIHFLVWTVNAHLAWALVIAGAFGLIVGLLVPRLRRLV